MSLRLEGTDLSCLLASPALPYQQQSLKQSQKGKICLHVWATIVIEFVVRKEKENESFKEEFYERAAGLLS